MVNICARFIKILPLSKEILCHAK